MEIEELCKKIDLPKVVVKKVIEFDRTFKYDDISNEMDKLFHRETWQEGRIELKNKLGNDSDGIKIFSCMLKCALKTYDKYIDIGIDQKVFIDTLKCFKRFINEHHVSYGTYAFDRDWWTSRQIAMQLFRIGELEYEMTSINNENFISIHIPSDAVMDTKRLRQSYIIARKFFEKYFSEYQNVKMVCSSWLLSPNLNKVLDYHSNILRFQKSFTITRLDIKSDEYMQWIFKNPKLLNDLPEDTSLQRNLKKYLLEGGKIGEAFGYLIKDPFLTI